MERDYNALSGGCKTNGVVVLQCRKPPKGNALCNQLLIIHIYSAVLNIFGGWTTAMGGLLEDPKD